MICPELPSNKYKLENRFISLSPFKRKIIQNHMVVFCHCPGGIIFPIVNDINGMVGGSAKKEEFNGVAFAEIMYYGREGYLCTPGINISIPPVKIEMADDLMAVKLAGDWKPAYLWCEAKKQCLCESPVPDGRKFGEVTNGNVKNLPLQEMESIYSDLVSFHISQL